MEEAIEWTWASTHEELEAVRFVLCRFFTLEDGCYVQNHIREDMAEYHKNAETNRRIALDREAKRKRSSTNRAPDVHEAPPNHKPLTTNQEPVTIEKEPRKRSTKKCPASFVVGEELLNWANQHGYTAMMLSRETEKFMDYTFKNAISDWDGAWRNWIRKANDSCSSGSQEAPWRKEQRERMQRDFPNLAARAPGESASQPIFEVEARNVTPLSLD
jgi:uncharacterized protein YdaU (DUF1376 family)